MTHRKDNKDTKDNLQNEGMGAYIERWSSVTQQQCDWCWQKGNESRTVTQYKHALMTRLSCILYFLFYILYSTVPHYKRVLTTKLSCILYLLFCTLYLILHASSSGKVSVLYFVLKSILSCILCIFDYDPKKTCLFWRESQPEVQKLNAIN